MGYDQNIKCGSEMAVGRLFKLFRDALEQLSCQETTSGSQNTQDNTVQDMNGKTRAKRAGGRTVKISQHHLRTDWGTSSFQVTTVYRLHIRMSVNPASANYLQLTG